MERNYFLNAWLPFAVYSLCETVKINTLSFGAPNLLQTGVWLGFVFLFAGLISFLCLLNL